MDFSTVQEALKDQMGDRHIMLSYQWDNQELVAKVYDLIVEHGINVWMDIHGGVTGEFLVTSLETFAHDCLTL